jgi:DNA-binding LacI/PurR family transcriptional regulator
VAQLLKKDDLRYRQIMTAIHSDIESGKYAPGRKLPTLREFSKLYGVDFRTVRRGLSLLSNEGLVSIKPGAGTFVSERIKQFRRKIPKICLVCRKLLLSVDQNHPAIGAYLSGCHKRCSNSEAAIQTMFYEENQFIEAVDTLISGHDIDGIIIPDGAAIGKTELEFLKNKSHVAVCGYELMPANDNWTITINRNITAALRKSVEHLRLFGHRRIGLVSFRSEAILHHVFGTLIFEHQMGNPLELITKVQVHNTVIDWEQLENFFNIKPLPTAVIVSDEFLADVLLASCDRRNIKIPDDLSIVAIQDLRPYGHRIPLTTCGSPEDLLEPVYVATDLLLKAISGKQLDTRHIEIEPTLRAKASTGLAQTAKNL